MLDFAFDVRPSSRLSCQIKVTEALDGLVVCRCPRSSSDRRPGAQRHPSGPPRRRQGIRRPRAARRGDCAIMRCRLHLAVLASLAVAASLLHRARGRRSRSGGLPSIPTARPPPRSSWGATEDEARQRAVEACKRLSKTCANGPAVTDDLKEVFAVMCCDAAARGLCRLGRGQPARGRQERAADVCRRRLFRLLGATLPPGRHRQEAVGGVRPLAQMVAISGERGQTPCANDRNPLLGRSKGSDPIVLRRHTDHAS